MNQIRTLLLAWKIAIYYKENEAKAVRLCANKIWKDIKDPDLQFLVRQLASKTTTDKQRIKTVESLEYQIQKQKIVTY